MDTDKKPLSDQNVSMLLSTAAAYSENAAKCFGLFITVLFGSLAFATALAKAGTASKTPLVPISVALLAFYIINFVAFQSALGKLTIVLRELSRQIDHWDFKNSKTPSVFQPERPILGSLGLPSIGYLIGSVLGFGGFVWIASVLPGP